MRARRRASIRDARARRACAQAARALTPFAFYAHLLGAGGGRRRFLARLGPEANDALDEFLNLALDYERRETPSLQGFLAWLRAARAEVKRDMEIARDEVRVMTVHGAKGLEAPIVILADTDDAAGRAARPPRLLKLRRWRAVVWAGRKDDDVGADGCARAGGASARRDDEYRRLLYVAMTRAADRLIVCGAEGSSKMPDGCWYRAGARRARGRCASRSQPTTATARCCAFASTPANALPASGKRKRSLRRRRRAGLARGASAAPASRADPHARRLRQRGADDAARRAPRRAQARCARLARAPAAAVAARTSRASGAPRAARAIISPRRQELADARARADRRAGAALLERSALRRLFAPGSRAEVPIVGRIALGGETVASPARSTAWR